MNGVDGDYRGAVANVPQHLTGMGVQCHEGTVRDGREVPLTYDPQKSKKEAIDFINFYIALCTQKYKPKQNSNLDFPIVATSLLKFRRKQNKNTQSKFKKGKNIEQFIGHVRIKIFMISAYRSLPHPL